MILFDLDGTLLPMDQDAFVHGYFKFLAKKMAPYGYDPEKLIEAVWSGTAAMARNDGTKRNEDVFWEDFARVFGEKALADRPLFDAFYRDEFQKARALCGFNPAAPEAVRKLKAAGFRVALATNPLFPRIATESRVHWAGLAPEDFEWMTTYENIGYCKPNPKYYTAVAEALEVQPSECLMVGNDAQEDAGAADVGMKVFLLTGCLINRNGADISAYPNGSFDALLKYAAQLKEEVK